MWMENFPRVHRYIANVCASNIDLQNVFSSLEDSLKEKDELRESKETLQKDMQNLSIDLMLVRQATNVKKEERNQIESVTNILDRSYAHLLKIINLLDDDNIKNMLSSVVLLKQNEVQKKLNIMNELQEIELQYKVAMENRVTVQDFRQWQRKLKATQEEYSNTDMEYDQLDRQWNDKLDRATQQRNNKIVSLVQLSMQIAKLQMPVSLRAALQENGCGTKAAALRGKSEPFVLQSALDFINNYAEESKVVVKANDMDSTMGTPLRSILVVRSLDSSDDTERSTSPTKQVHFAPLPSPIHNNTIDEMIDDEESPIDMSTINDDMDDDTDGDIGELHSESSQLEVENVLNTENFPERAIVEKVEILPPLLFSLSPASTRLDCSLSFKNLFSSNETMPKQDCEDDKKENANKQSASGSLENSDNSDNSDSMNFNDINFATANRNANDDFFLNFSDESSSEQRKNSLSYEL